MASDDKLEIVTFVTGYFQQNTYLVRERSSGATVLIDTGDGIAEKLQTGGHLHNGRLDMVLMTHTHLDHAWDLAAVKRAFPDTPVYAHRDELELLRALPRQGSMIGLSLEVEAAPDPDVLLDDGAELTLGRTGILAIHTPGHTPGGLCYLFEGAHCFVGDMLFANGVGRTDLPGGDPSKMGDSLLNRVMALSDEVVVYSGHGPETTIGRERNENPYILALRKGQQVF